LTLSLLIIFNCDVSLLKLRVLRVVLTCDLLILLPNDISFGSPVLVLQCLLVKELLFDLSFDSCSVDLLLQGLQSVQEDVVERICPLLEGHLCSVTAPLLQLGDFQKDLLVAALDLLCFGSLTLFVIFSTRRVVPDLTILSGSVALASRISRTL